METLYPFALCSTFGAIAIAVLTRSLPDAEARWLRTVAGIALSIRLVLAALFDIFPAARLFHEDADGYEWLGMAMARGWKGQGPLLRPLDEISQNYGYKYISAAIYYVFGQFAPLPAMFNSVIGVLAVLMVYRLARQFFHPLVARRATLLAAFFPSMILWSSVAIKDPLMSLLILIALYSCVSFKRRFSGWALLGIALSIIAIQPIRFYMVYFLGFAIITSLFLERGLRMVSGVYKQIFLLGAFAAMLAMVGLTGSLSQGASTLSLESVSNFRHGMAVSANSGFAADADISTPLGALKLLPLGMAELLLGPFPWQFGSLRALLAAPETICWWILFPSVIRGLLWSVRKRFSECSPLVLFAVIMSCAYSLMHGNIGSGFRQRAQIFVILFIFASFGWYEKRARRAGIDRDHLLVEELKERGTVARAA